MRASVWCRIFIEGDKCTLKGDNSLLGADPILPLLALRFSYSKSRLKLAYIHSIHILRMETLKMENYHLLSGYIWIYLNLTYLGCVHSQRSVTD